MTELDHATFLTAQKWAQDGTSFAIALVTESWGSSPRQKGAAMLIAQDGAIAGSVSAGCVEAEVIEAAQDCLAHQTSRLLRFGISDETAWSQGLSCGGKIAVICLPVGGDMMPVSLIEAIHNAITTRTKTALHIDSMTHKATMAPPEAIIGQTIIGQTIIGQTMIEQGTLAGDYHFPILPTRQLFIIGAGHIAQTLVPLALETGFETTVIDPRTSFITQDRFPRIGGKQAQLLADWPSQCLTPEMIDSTSALVTLTHNPVIDDEGLMIALASEAFHIAALGSRKTHANRLTRLAHHGAEALHRIKGPAGLALGAASPAEIAVSILAELIQTYRARGTP